MNPFSASSLLAGLGPYATAGIFLVLFIETAVPIGFVLPGDTLLLTAGLLCATGHLSLPWVLAAATAGAIAGAQTGYLIGRSGGRAPALRFGRYVLLTGERLDKAEALFTRHGGKIVTIARFTEELRQANGVIAGIARMPWPRFLAYNALGAALWVGAWSSAGYFAGNHITTPYTQVGRHSLYLPAAAVLLIATLLLRRRRTRRTAQPTPARLNVPRTGGNGQS